MDWTLEIKTELENAERARSTGKEGMARVCARRAAGIAARDFLTRHGIPSKRDSAYQSLKKLAAYPGLPPDLQAATGNLLQQVNEQFALPGHVDLISEAVKLIGGLA